MRKLSLYTVNDTYVNYLRRFDPIVVDNKDSSSRNFERKYTGIVLEINNMAYFAPLSSFKEKHHNMKEGIDLIKIESMAVVNLNNMIPVPESQITYCDIEAQEDENYKNLLRNEFVILKKKENIILSNAEKLYIKVTKYKSYLSKRCCNFELLEAKCIEYTALSEVASTSDNL